MERFLKGALKEARVIRSCRSPDSTLPWTPCTALLSSPKRRLLRPMVAELKTLPSASDAETGGLHDVGLAWRENVCDLGAHFTRDASEWLGSWAETPVSAAASQIWLRNASPVLGFDAVAKAQCAEIAWKLQSPRWTTEDQAMASYASSERSRPPKRLRRVTADRTASGSPVPGYLEDHGT
ncbi:unnamed protein product [Symbiodinium sp. CCMP2592]|nr:unnamed protein product [Symbiodinium sp. CCMP2592]